MQSELLTFIKSSKSNFSQNADFPIPGLPTTKMMPDLAAVKMSSGFSRIEPLSFRNSLNKSCLFSFMVE